MNLNDNHAHPGNKRNMIIFVVCVIGLFLLYDLFIHQPHLEKMKALQEHQMAEQAELAQATPAPSAAQSVSRKAALAQSRRITIETETLAGSVSLTGARIDDLSLKDYATKPQGTEIVTLLNPTASDHGYYAEFGWLSDNQAIRMPTKESQWQADRATLSVNQPVTLRWSNGQGLSFSKQMTLDDRYMMTVAQSVTNRSRQPVTVYPFALIGRDGLPADLTNAFVLHEGPIGYIGGELHEIDYDDLDAEENVTARAEKGWIGITDKYWLTALTPGKDYTDQVKYRFTGTPQSADKTHYQTDMMGAGITLQPGEGVTVPIEFFAGPKVVSILEDYSDQYDIEHFDLAVDFGMFYFLTRPFYEILTFLNDLLGSFAIALLVFTVLIKLCVFPLAQKSYRSFARMRKVTPQMIEIREKFGHDRQKMQKAIFDLYKKEDVNPMAGCFPILIQIPIFFALYKVFYVNIGMRHEPFWGWINDMSVADPTNVFELFGLLEWGAPSFLHIGLLPILMGFSMFMQQRLSPPPQDETQRIIFGIMPFWITILLAKFPAGLVIYWTWSNCLSILQQYVLLRQEGVKVNIWTRTREERKLEEVIEKQKAEEDLQKPIDHEDIEPVTKTIKPKKRGRKKK